MATRRLKSLIRRLLFRFYIWIHRRFHAWKILPYGKMFGAGRGTPVGRYYVEQFLKENAGAVKGRCLEFGDPYYKDLFPHATQYEALSLTPGDRVDYVCDIHNPENVPLASFDTIICTQVLEHLAYPEKAARSIAKLMKPGGVLLLTVPFLSPVHHAPADCYRFTPECLETIMSDAGLEVETLEFGGNCLVGTGSFLGMVAEDFTSRELAYKDGAFPYNVLVRARRPES